MSDPSDRHMVFVLKSGRVSYNSNFNVSGSQPLLGFSHEEVIDRLVEFYHPTSSENITEEEDQ